MQRKERKEQGKSAAAAVSVVTVAFAEDMELARQYQQLLEKNQIPAVIRRQTEMAQSGFSDIAILVPEDYLDEAHSLICQQAAGEDFFGMAFDEPYKEEYRDWSSEEDEDQLD
ncbi:MAG TPA: DUF2007 domain-containing protein [Anaerohalosphaeraceae bacterium]|nr:DUF2007 domain-containing protein [Phycisphaerae bacterium]HOK95041.1 DUF2007 domain-containing protein [Anaerohalosphaeraceae bacterium]HOL32472.1 DUF2007 domain-containing protein [Anaerohalosphaeraceae bacterium]HOM76958.1 DUF2007 domain-containing protein [Anaerohalosphaeraceae bacterium]HPC63891.1 DUF2007 domain-containing protein [Anaerohalosphaeraceae bacterium]